MKPAVKVLADGRVLAKLYDELWLLEDETCTPISVMKGHTGEILGFKVLANDRILTWSDDETMRLGVPSGRSPTHAAG